MAVFPPQSESAWQAGKIFMHCLAISSSAGRFGIRYKIQRLWWDDLLAFLATSIELFFLATLFFIPISTYFVGVTPPNLIEQATFWYRQFPMLSIVWLCRTSLALTLVQAFPALFFTRRLAVVFIVALAMMGICTLLAVTFGCAPVPIIRGQPPVIPSLCIRPTHAPPRLGIAISLSVDLLTDMILVALPVYCLWSVKLPRRHKCVVIAGFSTILLTLCTTILLIIFLIGPFEHNIARVIIVHGMGHINAATGLLACNALIIGTFLYRVTLTAHGGGSNSHFQSNCVSIYARPQSTIMKVDKGETTGREFVTSCIDTFTTAVDSNEDEVGLARPAGHGHQLEIFIRSESTVNTDPEWGESRISRDV